MITKRIDNITDIPKEYRKTIIPAPPSVKIELTARCDLKCSFCASSHKLREIGDMDFNLLTEILIDLKKAGVKEIGLFYLGESLLYPRLADAIKIAKVLGFEYVFLTTNGRLLTETKSRELINAGLDSLKFSFNFADREQYKEFTSVDGFDKVVENIKQAKEVRDDIFTETGHLCGLYASSIKSKMNKAVAKIKPFVDEHYWLPLYNQAGYTKGGKGNPGRIGALRPPLPCWQLFKEGHITWKGMLVGCCFAYEPKWDFGDLTKISFMEAWNSTKAQELRKASLKKKVRGTACEKCIYD